MKDFGGAVGKLADAFEGFTADLRDMADEQPQCGDGEDVDDDFGVAKAVAPVGRENIDDGTVITMRSGELRKVINAYRKLVRFAREGRIPSQDQRFQGHKSVRAVKHLIRKPDNRRWR